MNHRLAFILKILPIILVISGGWGLRLINLGYADYQGDEIKAFYLPAIDQSITDFLLTQRKGPLQFIITGMLTLIDPLYENEFLIRFLFSLAGCLALVFFYFLSVSLFGKRVSLYATFFLATNGFLVGLSRIAQYQSYVILGGILALYFFEKARNDQRYELSGIYIGFTSWAVALLAHYDALLIAPMAAFVLWEWRKSGRKAWRIKIRHLITAVGLAAVPVLVFYIPFLLHINEETRIYWATRLVEDAAGKLSSSVLLFNIYQPVYVLLIYGILGVAGIFYCILLLTRRSTADMLNWVPTAIPAEKFKKNLLAAFVWFLVSFVFMEGIVYQPGTHMYTYLIPAFIFIGMGVLAIEKVIRQFKVAPRLHSFFLVAILILFVFIFAQSYVIFVDHAQEYPWEDERFLFWTLQRPTLEITENYTLSMFGFPYFRDWEKIGGLIRDQNDFSSVSANEPDVVTNFYIRKGGRRFSPYRFYISIKNPRSFVPYINDRMATLVKTTEPMYRIAQGDGTLAEIFLIETR